MHQPARGRRSSRSADLWLGQRGEDGGAAVPLRGDRAAFGHSRNCGLQHRAHNAGEGLLRLRRRRRPERLRERLLPQLPGHADKRPLNAPIIGMAITPDGAGYWMVGGDGGVFAFGDATFYGSTGNITLNKPIVGMAATPDGKGYWFVASDGGVFAYGDAKFYGSMGGQPLNQPIVGMAAMPGGGGYYLVAADGGIFSFGDAPFYGSMGGMPLNKPIVGMEVTADGLGYQFVATDGGSVLLRRCQFFGSTGNLTLNQPIVGIDRTASGLATGWSQPMAGSSPSATPSTKAACRPGAHCPWLASQHLRRRARPFQPQVDHVMHRSHLKEHELDEPHQPPAGPGQSPFGHL